MTAYDYDRQCWTTGRPAAVLRVRQLAEELELLTDPDRGPQYAEYIGLHNPCSAIGEMITETQELIRNHGITLDEITLAPAA